MGKILSRSGVGFGKSWQSKVVWTAPFPDIPFIIGSV